MLNDYSIFLFKQLPETVDLKRLKTECFDIMSKVPFDERNQICLQTGGIDDWYEGTGAMTAGENLDLFDKVHPSLKGTWLDNFIRTFPYPIKRTRIARLLPRRCYSVHKDFHRTLHIALYTNPSSHFLFVDEQRLVHIPEDEHIWYMDTKRTHTAFNGGNDSRLHLIMRVDD